MQAQTALIQSIAPISGEVIATIAHQEMMTFCATQNSCTRCPMQRTCKL